jgi:hypothetical protein
MIWTASNRHKTKKIVSSCGHSNESSGSVECWEIYLLPECSGIPNKDSVPWNKIQISSKVINLNSFCKIRI